MFQEKTVENVELMVQNIRCALLYLQNCVGQEIVDVGMDIGWEMANETNLNTHDENMEYYQWRI